ncbi:MAG: flagellar basal body rod protein FlgC [Pseudomonadales bacterium]
MSMLDIFEVSGSAMAAQRVRLNTTASNLANADSVAEKPADTYRARHPVFAAMLENATSEQTAANAPVQVLGVVESNAPLQQRYEPDHPYADEKGYVSYPNVSPVSEMANMISASRAFQLNVEVMNTAKSLSERLLSMGQ